MSANAVFAVLAVSLVLLGTVLDYFHRKTMAKLTARAAELENEWRSCMDDRLDAYRDWLECNGRRIDFATAALYEAIQANGLTVSSAMAIEVCIRSFDAAVEELREKERDGDER